MDKYFLSFNERKKDGSDLLYKFQMLIVFFSISFLNLFSSQNQKEKDVVSSDAIITVVGDAVIYSKDESFNAQVSKNKDLRANSNIAFGRDNALEISARSTVHIAKVTPSKKVENVVSASKKSEKSKSKYFTKKYVDQQIKGLENDGHFMINSKSGTLSFILPSNDSPSAANSFVYQERLELASLMYSYHINYHYKNSTAKTRVFNDSFSVRPPPALI